MKYTTSHGRRRGGVALKLGNPETSVYRYDSGQLRFVRVAGTDSSLPDALLFTRPQQSQINSPWLLTTVQSRVVTGLRPVTAGLFRGDLLAGSGARCLLLVRCLQTFDGAPKMEISRYPQTGSVDVSTNSLKRFLKPRK